MLTIDVLLRESQVGADRIERLHSQRANFDPKRIGEAIDALAEKQRLALALRFYESLTVDEIATVLGSKSETVSTLLARAMEGLCTHLEKDLGSVTSTGTAAAGGASS